MRWLALATGLIAACSAPQPSFVPLPDSAAASWILGARVGPQDFELTAVDGDLPPAQFIVPDASGRLHALAYDRSLAGLVLPPGPLGAAMDCERSCALLTPTRSFVRDMDPARSNAWVEASGVDPQLAAQLVPDGAMRCSLGCLELEEAVLSFDVPGQVAFLLPEPAGAIEAESALVGLTDGSLLRVREAPGFTWLCGPTGDTPTAGAFDEQAQRLWIARADRAIGWMDLETLHSDQPCPFVRTATAPPGALVLRLSVTAGADPPRLLVLSGTGAVARLTGPSWRSLGAVKVKQGAVDVISGFILEHGETAYFGATGDDVGILVGDQLSHQGGFALGIKPAEAHSALLYQGNVYFGFYAYNLFIRRGGAGMIVPLDEGTQRMNVNWDDPDSLTVLQGRMFTALGRGLIGEWSARTGYCQLQGPFAIEGTHRLLNVGGSLFRADYDGVSVSGRWLKPTHPDSCGPP